MNLFERIIPPRFAALMLENGTADDRAPLSSWSDAQKSEEKAKRS